MWSSTLQVCRAVSFQLDMSGKLSAFQQMPKLTHFNVPEHLDVPAGCPGPLTLPVRVGPGPLAVCVPDLILLIAAQNPQAAFGTSIAR